MTRSRSVTTACLVLLGIVLAAFCAAAPASPPSCFFFVQLADTQLGFSSGNADLAVDIEHFRKAVDHINRLKPAFVIVSGDFVNAPHDPKQIRAFWRVAREIRPDVPLYLVPGNHDIGQATAANVRSYEKLFGRDHYAFSYGGAEFIVLDSCLIHDADADPDLRASQRKWFEETLAAARAKNPPHIFVLSHHPWFVKTPDEADAYQNIPQAQRRDYLDLMSRFGVDYALAGHYHRNSAAEYGPVHLIVTGPVSRSLGNDPVGLRVFRIYPDRVEHDYYALDKVPAEVSLGAAGCGDAR